MSNELSTKVTNFKQLLEKAKPSLAEIAPKTLDPSRMLKLMLVAASRQPQLYDCSPESVVRCLLTSAELGLELAGVKGHAFAVPFRNKVNNKLEATFVVGYKGLVHLAMQSGKVESISARVVNLNDKFEVVYGVNETIIHYPNLFDPGEPIAAYAVAKMKDGGTVFEVMTKQELTGIKNRTRSRDKNGSVTGPWQTDELEMWKKTVVRRLAKMLPLGPEFERSLEDEDEHVSQPLQNVYELNPADIMNSPQEVLPEIAVQEALADGTN